MHADVGMLELGGRLRGRRPEPEVHQHGDVYTAVLAANAVLAALVQRATTGVGQHLDVAMGQAAVYVNEWAAAALQPPVGEYGGFDTWNHHTYPLGDGSYVTLVGNPVRLFPVWVERLNGSAEILTDPRFATPEARAAHMPAVVAVLDELTRSFPSFEALEAVLEPWMLAAHVRSVSELSQTDWARQRGLTVEVAPGLPVPAAPWLTDAAEIGAAASVAALGEHNRSVLARFGFSDDDIDALYDKGVLRSC